jgi:hypothetical protein
MAIVSNSLPALVIFGYNRPTHLRRVIDQLSRATLVSEIDLYFFIDGPKTDADKEMVAKVREIAASVTFARSVSLAEGSTNLGLAESVISGVSQVLKNYESVIVLEDDILVSPCFLTFMVDALAKFATSREVFSISGYNYPLKYRSGDPDYYLSHRSSSWGWATWRDRWKQVDWSCSTYEKTKSEKSLIQEFNRGGNDLFDLLTMQMEGKIDSWSIRFDYALFENRSFCLHPKLSLVENIGFDGSGTHPSSRDLFKQPKSILEIHEYPPLPTHLSHSKLMQKRFDAYFRPAIFSYVRIKRLTFRSIRVILSYSRLERNGKVF